MYAQHSTSSQPVDPRVSYVIRRICQNATSKILLSDLAQEARLTPSHLQHLFRKNVGRSVKNLMSELRLIQAERLLKHSELTVAEVARRVGFEDRSNFHRSFKKQFGVTPLSLRSPRRTSDGLSNRGNNGNNGQNGRNDTNGNGKKPAGQLILLLEEKKTSLTRLEGQVELLEGLLKRKAAKSVERVGDHRS